MASVAVERTLVKSPPELWDELASEAGLSRWLGEVRVRAKDPPRRLEWDSDVAQGVIELEASGWGTKIRAEADANRLPAWERMHKRHELERCLKNLLDDLGASSLTSR
jgi:hypothetical protein